MVQLLRQQYFLHHTTKQGWLAGFCQKVEKTFFSMVKTGLAKILTAGKNRFMPELSSKKT